MRETYITIESKTAKNITVDLTILAMNGGGRNCTPVREAAKCGRKRAGKTEYLRRLPSSSSRLSVEQARKKLLYGFIREIYGDKLRDKYDIIASAGHDTVVIVLCLSVKRIII